MKTRFCFFLIGFLAAASSALQAAISPFRLTEIGATRFTRDAFGMGRIETGRLNIYDQFIATNVSPALIPADLPAGAIGRPLIFTEAWHAYGELGLEARANFRLRDNGAPITAAGLIYFGIEADPEARFDLGQVVNLSTRGLVSPTAFPTLIGGFIIEGQARRVLIRAIGPGLTGFGITDALPDPYLTVRKGATIMHYNDNWNERPDAAEIIQAAAAVGAFPLAANSRDAVLLVELPPGGYTASVSAQGGGTQPGSAMIEIYIMP